MSVAFSGIVSLKMWNLHVTILYPRLPTSAQVLLFGMQQRGKVVDKLRDALELSERNVMPRDLPDLCKRAMEGIQQNQNINKRI